MAADMTAGASAGALAVTGAGASAGGPRAMGPGLTIGMTETEVFDRLNGWGIARDGDLRDLADNLAQTQSVVSATFEQARAALLAIVVDFRTEAETMRLHSVHEATLSVGRLDFVVNEARGRFDLQEARLAQGLGELGQRQQAFETWAQAEPARVAAFADMFTGGCVTYSSTNTLEELMECLFLSPNNLLITYL